jgi:NAD(P)-dependent dehydrogenase (short-subunit alcohol dehydrogenase family)
MTSLASKPVALVTGGTTGIGLAVARLLHAQGHAVVVTGQNPDTLAAAKRALPDDVVVLRADARSLEDADRVAAELSRRFGRVDVAFLNAGVAKFAPLEAIDEAFFDDQFDVNVKGLLFTLQKILPLLGKGSSVILNSSVIAGKGIASTAVYAATKAAVSSLVRSLSVELAPRGIRVNAVSPGPIETPIYGKLGIPADALGGFKDGMTAQVPLARFGSSDEVARTVAFLASAAASYVSGADLAVDGALGAT